MRRLESPDSLAAVAYLCRARPGEPVAIIGQSLGGVATVLAAPPLQVDAVVLEAVFPTIADATRDWITQRIEFLGRLVAPLLLAAVKPIVPRLRREHD